MFNKILTFLACLHNVPALSVDWLIVDQSLHIQSGAAFKVTLDILFDARVLAGKKRTADILEYRIRVHVKGPNYFSRYYIELLPR